MSTKAMNTYENEELEKKITNFLDKKTRRFRDLTPHRHEQHYVDIEALADKIHSIWFKQAQA